MVDRDELHQIRKFTVKSESDKVFNSLLGIVEGIGIDGIVDETEIKELLNWTNLHYEFIDRVPFNELIPFINQICKDGKVTDDEFTDLKWLLTKLAGNNEYYNFITVKIQELEGILHGVLSNNQITDKEIDGLKKWLFDNETLIGVYPFDELEALIIGIKEDGIITEEERNYLKLFISEFVNREHSVTIDFKQIDELRNTICISGVCTINPLIEFKDKKFCFTGISEKYQRKDFAAKITNLGGIYNDNVNKDTDYLIIGGNSNPCWAYSCYGRKVEKAMNMRKLGSSISIIKEVDFEDAAIE